MKQITEAKQITKNRSKAVMKIVTNSLKEEEKAREVVEENLNKIKQVTGII